MAKNGSTHGAINAALKYQLGAKATVASGTITNIAAAALLHGDPCHASPRVIEGVTLTARHELVMTGALAADASTLTTELQDALVSAEPANGRTSAPLAPGRSHWFPESTLNERLRLRGITPKALSLYNGRRNAHQSARVRNALREVDPASLRFIDASCLRATDFQRRRGRARKGKKARAPTTAMSNGGVLKTIMGVFSLGGFVEDACEIIDGPMDNDRCMQWAYEKLGPSDIHVAALGGRPGDCGAG